MTRGVDEQLAVRENCPEKRNRKGYIEREGERDIERERERERERTKIQANVLKNN